MGEHDSGTVVLRADFGAYKRWFSQPVHRIGLILGLAGVSGGSALRGGQAWLLPVVIGVTVVACVAGVAVHIATSRVTIGDGRVEYCRWLRRTTLRLDDDLVGAVGVLMDSPVGRTSYRLVVRARSGGPRIWLNGAYWDHQDLLRVAEVTGSRVTTAELTPREFDAIAPGTMPWRTLHPVWFGGSLAVVIIAGVVVGVFAWFDVKNIPPYDEQPPKAVDAATIRDQDALVVDVQQAVGGRWEASESRLTACTGTDDHKGWQRGVSASLAQEVSDTGEDVVSTPVRATRSVVDQVGAVLAARGYADPDDDLGESDDGYTTVRAYAVPGAPRGNDVTVTFSRGDYVRIQVYGDCEVPGR